MKKIWGYAIEIILCITVNYIIYSFHMPVVFSVIPTIPVLYLFSCRHKDEKKLFQYLQIVPLALISGFFQSVILICDKKLSSFLIIIGILLSVVLLLWITLCIENKIVLKKATAGYAALVVAVCAGGYLIIWNHYNHKAEEMIIRMAETNPPTELMAADLDGMCYEIDAIFYASERQYDFSDLARGYIYHRESYEASYRKFLENLQSGDRNKIKLLLKNMPLYGDTSQSSAAEQSEIGKAGGEIADNTGDVVIEQSEEYWETKDYILSAYPKDAFAAGVTSKGVYYYLRDEKETAAEERYILEYHFMDLEGEDTFLFREEVPLGIHSFYVDGDSLITTRNGANGEEVIRLEPDKEIEVLFEQDGMSGIQTSERYLVIQKMIPSESRTDLILMDKETKGESVIYQADYNDFGGEVICGASVGEDFVFFHIADTSGNKEKVFLYVYDIESSFVKDKIALENRCTFAACMNGTIFLSENNQDMTDRIYGGKLGVSQDGKFVETAVVQAVTSSDLIRRGRWVNNGLLMNNSRSGFFWNKDNNTIYVYTTTNDVKVSDIFETENGFAFLGRSDQGYLIREVTFLNPLSASGTPQSTW